MGTTFNSTVRLTRVDAPQAVTLEGEFTGVIRPDGRMTTRVPVAQNRTGVLCARPTGVGRALATYTIPIEGRDEWLAAARLEA